MHRFLQLFCQQACDFLLLIIEDASSDAPPPPALVDGLALEAKPSRSSFAFDLQGRTELDKGLNFLEFFEGLVLIGI